ncbi:MAG: hypothetical protein Q8L48_24445 [Archangium sp.]|nr:hypothetical protein [Archangium sp.]
MSNDPKDDPPPAAQDLFPFDEMSTGETSSLLRRANVITGRPERQLTADPALKPMTGAQLAFRPSAPPRQATGTQAAHKPAARPATGTQPAFTPTTGTQPAFKPVSSAAERPRTGAQPAYKPGSGNHPAVGRSGTGTNTFPTFKPAPSRAEGPTAPSPAPREEEEEEPPVFDPERLQAQIRALSLTDSALGRVVKSQKPNKAPSSSAEDTFVKTKMKQAEARVPDFDLDEDLG